MWCYNSQSGPLLSEARSGLREAVGGQRLTASILELLLEHLYALLYSFADCVSTFECHLRTWLVPKQRRHDSDLGPAETAMRTAKWSRVHT